MGPGFMDGFGEALVVCAIIIAVVAGLLGFGLAWVLL